MATELDVSKSRRFDIAMSRRTRRSTSLVACFQDQYVPSLAQQRHQELKAFLDCQDAEKALQLCEDAEQLIPCLDEDGELKIPQAPLQFEDVEQTMQYQGEQENKSQQYSGEEQKKAEQHEDEEEKTPELYQDEDERTSQYQDEVLMTQNQRENHEDTEAVRCQDSEKEAPQQCQEADEKASKQSEDDEELQKEEQGCCSLEQEPEQLQGVKKLATPLRAIDNVPRFSLQELIQQKQLQAAEAKPTTKLSDHGESVLPDHKVSGSGAAAAAAGGTTLAMVIKRPEGGKKSMGMIRRCVKALNQMIKTKHGSKKNLHF